MTRLLWALARTPPCLTLPPPCRARGISALVARQALVASFGAEVTRELAMPELLGRVQADVSRTLASANLTAPLAAGGSSK